MMKTKTIIIAVLIIVTLATCIALVTLWLGTTFSKTNKCINGIYVSELLINVSNEKHHTDYCKVLKKATENDENSIRQLVLLEYYDGTSYDHGSVIVDIIELLGEEAFLKAISTIEDRQKKYVASIIKAGLEYGNNPRLQGLSFKEAFPSVFDYISN